MILTCSRCKKEKPETEFYKANSTKTGFVGKCKMCCRAWHKAHRQNNIDKFKAKNNAYYKANKEKCLARNKIYREHNKEKKKAMDRAYYIKNKEKHLLKSKAYHAANKEKCSAISRNYQKTHKDKHNECNRLYHKRNKDKIKALRLANKDKRKIYVRENADKFRGYCRKRQSLKRGNIYEPYINNYIFERDGWICQLCGQKINRRLKYPNPRSKSIDHIVPLSKGGDDSPTNVQATHLRCNVGKNATNKGQLRLFGW